jgi:hypothetical protein
MERHPRLTLQSLPGLDADFGTRSVQALAVGSSRPPAPCARRPRRAATTGGALPAPRPRSGASDEVLARRAADPGPDAGARLRGARLPLPGARRHAREPARAGGRPRRRAAAPRRRRCTACARCSPSSSCTSATSWCTPCTAWRSTRACGAWSAPAARRSTSICSSPTT